MADHDRYVACAIELARSAAASGNEPFGALLVRDGEVIAEAENSVVTDDDIAAHPELELARWAASELAPAERGGTTMYASTEPCPMCATALYNAGLRRVVYSVPAGRAAELAGTDPAIPSAEIFARASESVTVVGPVRRAEGERVHESYWGD